MSRLGAWLPWHRETEEDRPHQARVRVWGRRAWARWRRDGERRWEVEEFFWEAANEAR